MNKKIYFSLLVLINNASFIGMEQQYISIITTLLKVNKDSDWKHFDQFQKKVTSNKENLLSDHFGQNVTEFCKKNPTDPNTQLLSRWIELKIYDEIQRTEDPHRLFPDTLREMWYLEHGTQPYPYEGILTKLCHTFIEEDTEQLLQQAKKNIEHAINI